MRATSAVRTFCAPLATRAVRLRALGITARASSSTVASGDNPLMAELSRLRKPVELSDKYVGLTGAEIFRELMAENGVKKIFGYPGGAILPVFDAIFECPDFDFILSRHEQGAGHMAQGYARVTGKPGIVLVTSGPGATNTITPMQDALMDGTPIIVFAGQVATTAIGAQCSQHRRPTIAAATCLLKKMCDLTQGRTRSRRQT
eukprot:SAG11_NODE_408_length_9704_cov_6.496774_8_plen_203_part_00